jgi:acetyl esterase/lipase
MKNKLPPILLALYILMLTACGPKAAAFDTAKFGTAEKDVTYCTMNGLPQTMDVYYPSSGGPWPVVLYVHGGGWYQGDKAEGEGWRELNDSGFLVVSVNYRLGDYQTKFPAMIEDVKCAVRHLRAHSSEYNLDPDNIGVIGASAGGHLVALLGTADESAGWDVGEYLEQSSVIQAVVVISGISDFTDHIPNGLNTSIFYAFGGLAGRNTPENLAASPISYITTDDPPFLVIHGDRDGVVPVEQAWILQDKLTEAGVASRLIIVKGGDHGLQSPTGGNVDPPAAQVNQMILEFLEEELK